MQLLFADAHEGDFMSGPMITSIMLKCGHLYQGTFDKVPEVGQLAECPKCTAVKGKKTNSLVTHVNHTFKEMA
jgi:hypothetical protein